jgi:chorismate mutase
MRALKVFLAKARRYTRYIYTLYIFHALFYTIISPDEYPFTPISDLPKPVLSPLDFPPVLYPNNINANPSILSFYTRSIVPRITARATLALSAVKRANGVTGDEEYEDDGNYGSAATVDIEVLQAISKRVHHGGFISDDTIICSSSFSGKFIAESKFISKPSDFVPHIIKPNPAALEGLIVKPEVERNLLLRLRKKAAVYAQDPTSDANGSEKIDVDGVVNLYESYIIPLTKEVEVSPSCVTSMG